MAEIFLSASVPEVGRGNYADSANPFLIQLAIREFFIAAMSKHRVVWGGHPAITPMIWAICEDLNVEYSKNVVLYQSKFFQDRFPEENEKFKNVIFTEVIEGKRDMSLLKMREDMLSRPDLSAAVFIGGMDGVEQEFQLYQNLKPMGAVIVCAGPGGAAKNLAEKIYGESRPDVFDLNFSGFFKRELEKL